MPRYLDKTVAVLDNRYISLWLQRFETMSDTYHWMVVFQGHWLCCGTADMITCKSKLELNLALHRAQHQWVLYRQTIHHYHDID